jgi:hypothetical protein
MEPTATPQNSDPKKPRKAPADPRADLAMAATWVAIGAAWKSNPDITVRRTTQAEFAAAAQAHHGKLQARLNVGDPRALLSGRLDEIRDIFADQLEYIKAALLPIFKRGGLEDAYPSFGIGREDGVWQFPTKRLKAQDAYDKAVAGLKAQGLTAGDAGADRLGPLAEEFRKKYEELGQLDGKTSAAVGQKNLGRPYLKKTARSLRYIIRGNEPDTWEQVWREWGTQKEKF